MSEKPQITDIDRLTAMHGIAAVKAAYCRCVDTKDWEAMRAIFTESALLFYPETEDRPLAVDDAIAMIGRSVLGARSAHRVYMPEYRFHSSERASVIWAMDDRVIWSAEAAARSGIQSIRGFGYYHEEYSKIDGAWLIDRLKVKRLWLDRTYPTILDLNDPSDRLYEVKRF
jgi:hypothetical protein